MQTYGNTKSRYARPIPSAPPPRPTTKNTPWYGARAGRRSGWYEGIAAILAGLLGSVSLPACAQPAPAADAPGTAKRFDEITVTARRRAESVERVPIAIEVVTPKALIERGIQTEADLQSAVSGLVLRSNNNSHQIDYVIRGEAQEPYSGAQPGVQPYMDDVALSGSYGASLYDMAGVQVLKGPQGTLFGRNTTGGAVLFQTADPKDRLGGYASVQYGNLNRLVTEGALNLPLDSDRLLLRVAGTYQSGGAFVHNIYDDTMLGNNNVASIRGTLVWRPSPAITNRTVASYTHDHGTSNGNIAYYVEPCGGTGSADPCLWTPGNPTFQSLLNSPKGTYVAGYPAGYVYPGGLAGLPAFLKAQGPYVVDDNAPSPYADTSELVVNTTTIDLGGASLKNIFGFTHFALAEAEDSDGTPYPIFQTGGDEPGGDNLEHRTTQLISDELQLSGKAAGGRLTWLVGGFFSSGYTIYNSPNVLQLLGVIPGGFYQYAFRYTAKSTDTSYAAFTQETYALTDRLNITGGLRMSWDAIGLRQLPNSALLTNPQIDNHTTVGKPSWTVSLDYRLGTGVITYVTTRGSWRSGGYNPFVAPVAGNRVTAAEGGNYFPPETVRDVELGIKFDREVDGVPVRLNADLFDAWYRNVEKTGAGVNGSGAITAETITIPAANVRGIELNGQIQPAPWLQIGGNFTWDDARYTDNIGMLLNAVAVFGPYSDTPKFSGGAYAEITGQLPGNVGRLIYHVDVFAESLFHTSSVGDTFEPGDIIPGYALLNMRLDWHDPMGTKGMTASVFAKNVTGKVYYSGGGAGIASFGINNANFGAPRTYGFQLRADF